MSGAQSYDVAYTKSGNVLPPPIPNFVDEGNSAKYVSKAIGGRKRRTNKKRRTSMKKRKTSSWWRSLFK
jgi:hypothetical protein